MQNSPELTALDRQAQAFAEQGDWDKYIEVLIDMTVLLDGDDEGQVSVLREVARTFMDRLGDPEKAVATYEQLLDLDIGDDEASQVVLESYHRNKQWQDMVGLMLDRLDVVEDPGARVALYMDAAHVYAEYMGEPEGGYLLLTQALQGGADSPEAYKTLVRYAKLAGQEDNLDTLLREVIRERTQGGDAQAVELLVTYARFLRDRDEPDMAAVYLERVFRADPDHREAFDILRRTFREDEDWGALVEILAKRLEATYDREERLELLHQLGALYAKRLDDAESAVAAYQAILEIEPQDGPAEKALASLYQQMGGFQELADMLEERLVDAHEDAERVGLLLELGELYFKKIDDPRRAVDAYSEVVAIEAAHPVALEALEILFLKLEKWDDYLGLMDHRLGFNPEGEELARLLKAKALVVDQVYQDTREATRCYEQALQVDPTDEESMDRLQDLYADASNLDALVEVTQARVRVSQDPAVQVDSLLHLGQVLLEAGDTERSIEALQALMAVDDRHAEAMTLLEGVYTREERWPALIELQKHRAAIAAPDEKIAALLGVVALTESHGEAVDAIAALTQVLELDRKHAEAREAMQRVLGAAQQWDALLAFLESEIKHTRDLGERSAYLAAQGEVLELRMDDADGARAKYEQAAELDPNNIEAVEPLVEFFMREELWARARPRLKQLLAHAEGQGDEASVVMLHGQLGRACDELGLADEAGQHYVAVLEFEPSNHEALAAAARLRFDAKVYDEAASLYRRLIVETGDKMASGDLIDAYGRAGACYRELDDIHRAREMYERALEVDPYHEESLRALRGLMSLDDATLDSSAVERLQDLLAMTIDPVERFDLCVEIGDALFELESLPQAADAYGAALEIEPESKAILHKLLTVFSTAEEWRLASEVLGRLSELETDPSRKAHLLFTIGAMFRDQLGDPLGAIPFYDAVLLMDLTRLDAFEAIEEILKQVGDWERLQRAYRKMLERFEAAGITDPAMLFVLFRNLGEIYRSQMGRIDDAIAAYELALQMQPEDLPTMKTLAALYEQTEGGQEAAIEVHRRLLAVEPQRLKSYRALLAAYKGQRDYDRAWCVASVLASIGQASEGEVAFYERYRPQGLTPASRQLNGEDWALAMPAELEPRLTEVFAALAVHGASVLSRDLKDWGVHKRKDRAEGAAPQLADLVEYMSRTIGVPQPALYARPMGQGLQNPNTSPRALLAGNDMLTEPASRSYAFVIAKALVLLNDSFYMASAYPLSSQLKAMFNGAFAVTTEKIIADPSATDVERIAQSLASLPPAAVIDIQSRMQKLLQSGKNPNVSEWLRATEKLANRIAFVLCGDLKSAIKGLNREAFSISKLTLEDKIADLLAFSITEEYFQLRDRLGFRLG